MITYRTDPKQYKRLLFEWVPFQDFAHQDSLKKVTFVQQILTVITNIQGNAGQRLGHTPSMVHASITPGDFIAMLDEILEVVDPQDREASFLEKAKPWRDLMGKCHRKTESYDSY